MLDPPGAGIPFWQRLTGKYVLLPWYCHRYPWDAALDLLDHEATVLLDLAEGRDEATLTRPTLVPRQIGLEDSSRCWSFAMVLEHLTIMSEGVGRIVDALTHGRQPDGVVRTEDLKPSGRFGAGSARDEYLQMLATLRRRVTDKDGDRDSTANHPHPWFGPLIAAQWVSFLPFHQRIHLLQARRIVAKNGVF